MSSERLTDSCVYRVRIEYREPTYELRTGPKPAPYRWTYEIVATSTGEASAAALSEFRTMATLSSVGWTRQVVGVFADAALSR